MKIGFAASSGGHFEQLLMLKALMEKYESFIVTEKVSYASKLPTKAYYIKQVNRKEPLFVFKMLINSVLSFGILCKEKPDVIISTGVLATIPICILAKLTKKKVIYIESFAKVTSPTETGKLMYKIADRFYVQWESMLEFYPEAKYVGGIY